MSTTLMATVSSDVRVTNTCAIVTTFINTGTVATAKLFVQAITVMLYFFTTLLIWLPDNHNKLKIIFFVNLI